MQWSYFNSESILKVYGFNVAKLVIIGRILTLDA